MLLQRFLNLGLGIKFAIMVIAILMTTTSVVTYIYLRAQHQLLLESLNEKGRALGHFVSLITPQSVLQNDTKGMNEFMGEASRGRDIVYVLLMDEHGKNLTRYLDANDSYVKNAIAETGDKNIIDVVNRINLHPDIINLKFPVRHMGKPLGELHLGLSKKSVDDDFLRNMLKMLVANAVIILFLSVCIYYAFRFMAIEPIQKLRYGLKRVADGNFLGTVTISTKDEIGSLTDSFNSMVSELKLSNTEKDKVTRQLLQQAEQLSRLNTDLETRVEESSRIMRDLHDDVGAKLLTLVHLTESPGNAEIARSALKNLRETIRGLSKKETTVEIVDSLGDWEAEARERLQAAGIQMQWVQSDNLPDISLNNRQVINLSRMLRETISNVIHHAHARNVCIESEVSDTQLTVYICDDGVGVTQGKWEHGTGLNNIIRRAQEISGAVQWYPAMEKISAFASGCCIEIKCPLGR